MSKVKEFHIPFERKGDFRTRIGQHEIQASKCAIDGRSAWLVKIGTQTYWAEDRKINLTRVEGGRVEKFADQIDTNIEGFIREALRTFETSESETKA